MLLLGLLKCGIQSFLIIIGFFICFALFGTSSLLKREFPEKGKLGQVSPLSQINFSKPDTL